MRKTIRLVHTSDLHAASLGDRACLGLKALVAMVGRRQVDLVIIAGDLFDSGRVKTDLVEFVAGQLGEMRAPVIILPGNHDYVAATTAYGRMEIWSRFPNVHILRAAYGERLELPDIGVSLWGKAHDSYDSEVRPLAGIPGAGGNGTWHIAIAHGYYVDSEPAIFPSYHISRSEIVESAGWDYIALGHVPMFQCVCEVPVKAYYSGSVSLNGRIALVEFNEETGVEVTPYSLDVGQY